MSQIGVQTVFDAVTVCLLLPQIRMQAQGSLLQGSMMSNFINIYQTEGTRGLWRVSCFHLLSHKSFIKDASHASEPNFSTALK